MSRLVLVMLMCVPATASAQLGRDVISKAIRKHLPEVIVCYEQPGAPRDATTVVTFVIGRDGRVTKREVTGPAGLAECLGNVIAKIVFPRSASATKVVYPFHIDFAGN